MSKNRIIAVTGMTGVGKDYLVERANEDYGLTTVNWGTLLGEELAENRDLMMDVVDPQKIRAGQFTVCRKILRMQPALVTCHAVRPTPEGDGYAYDLEVEQLLNPHSYVFVTAPPELIHERVRRRNEKGERKSPEIPVEEIGRVQQTKLDAVEELAGIQNSDILVLNNVDAELVRNVQMLGQRIGQISLDGYGGD